MITFPVFQFICLLGLVFIIGVMETLWTISAFRVLLSNPAEYNMVTYSWAVVHSILLLVAFAALVLTAFGFQFS